MSGDDSTDGIGVDQTDVEDEGDEMMMKDGPVEDEVNSDERPSDEERDEAQKSG